MSNPTDELLNERGRVHGDFTEHACITQELKYVMQSKPGWARLSAVQREALEMNAHKVGRILAGNPDHEDHWDDIAGYARLVSQRLSTMRKQETIEQQRHAERARTDAVMQKLQGAIDGAITRAPPLSTTAGATSDDAGMV